MLALSGPHHQVALCAVPAGGPSSACTRSTCRAGDNGVLLDGARKREEAVQAEFVCTPSGGRLTAIFLGGFHLLGRELIVVHLLLNIGWKAVEELQHGMGSVAQPVAA